MGSPVTTGTQLTSALWNTLVSNVRDINTRLTTLSTGTPNTLLKYTPSGNTITSSQIYENAGNVGIGVGSPTAPLHIFGTANTPTEIFLQNSNGASDVYGDPGIRMKSRSSDYRIFANDETKAFFIWDQTKGSPDVSLD
jgi:hypothetical protein